MLTVISPAKRLDESPHTLPKGLEATTPNFEAEATKLVSIIRDMSVADLRALMNISEPLAGINHDRFRTYKAKPDSTALKPAAFCFNGDTYTGLEIKTLDTKTLRWAQNHLRILSGLYGLLRPLDLIQPYRLEMGSKLANPKGSDLYAFWGNKIAKALNKAGEDTGTDTLINCASNEYFHAIDHKTLKLRVITPTFLEMKGNKAKTISFFAKKARGAMARFISENQLTDPAHLTRFAMNGYIYASDRSTPNQPVFLREAYAEAI